VAEPGGTWVEKGESTITPYGRGLAHNKIRAARKQPEQNHQQFLYGSLFRIITLMNTSSVNQTEKVKRMI
jgi:hypothetical protein